MARMSSNEESPRRDYGDKSQLTNWILDSKAICHMTPDISDFMLVSLVEIDTYIKVSGRNFITVKQTGEAQIKYVEIVENPSLLCYTTYYYHQTCAIDYFLLLC